MILCILGVALVVITFGAGHVGVSAVGNTCSAYVYPGADGMDIKIAAVLGIHESDDDKCNSIVNPSALQNAIALLWAASLLDGNNRTGSFIPGVRIGIEVYDDCNTKYLAAMHAGALAGYNRGITSCSADSGTSSQEIPIAGVIGTSTSHTTTVIASVLEPVSVPVVGPSATVAELSDNTMYANFMSLVPSDLRQAKVMIDLAKHFSWSYIVGVSTSDNYGRDGMAELIKLANEEMICVSLVSNFDQFSDDEMMKFVRTTLANMFQGTKKNLGIVYFGLDFSLIRFLKYVERERSSWSKEDNDHLKKLYWLASDGVVPSQELAQLISYYSTNIFIVSPFIVNINSFKEYFVGFIKHPPEWMRDPWKSALSSVVKNNLRCNNYNFTEESLAGCRINDYLTFDSYIPSVLDAVYLLANTIKNIHRNACKGVSGPCDAFKSELTNGLLKRYELLELNYSTINVEYIPDEFSKSQRSVKIISRHFEVSNQPLYSLMAISKNYFQKVAEFKDDQITMYPDFTNLVRSSECNTICEECIYLEKLSYLFYPGDYIFLGIFSMMWQSEKDPYKCGSYREKSMSYVAMEAFINAINYLRNSTGINFGYLILDDCYSTLTLTRMLNGVLSGDITVQSIGSNKMFNASKVVVAIGAQSSDVTMAALPILTELNIPMISYSATNPNLDDRMLYPYFSRTVSSDSVQARVLVDILKQYNVTYVGVIAVHNKYGLGLYKLFRSFAELEKICVDDAKEVTVLTPGVKYDTFLQDYKSKRIQVIVIIAMDKIVSTFLTAVKQDDIFVFIGSEAWGPNIDVISYDYAKKARGALVLGAVNLQLNDGLKEHLQNLDAFGNKSTLWLWDFWQDEFQCDMPGGFSNIHGNNTCNSSTSSSLRLNLDSMVNSPLAVHASLATISAGKIVSSFLNARKQMPFKPEEFTAALHSVGLMSETTEIQPFLDSGNGNSGFDIYNVQLDGSSKDRYAYVKVGSYRNNTGLTLDRSRIKFYDAAGHEISKVESSCLPAGKQCKAICEGGQPSSSPVAETSTQYTTKVQGGASETSAKTAAIILAVFLGLSVIIIIILIVLGYFILTGRINIKSKDTKNMTYTTLQRAQDNSYSSPSDSNTSDIPPQLPVRSTAGNIIFSPSKALSDIVSPSHFVAAEIVPTMDRANSLPELYHHSIVQTQKEQPKIILSPQQYLPTRNMVQSSSNESQTMDGTEQVKINQNVLPASNTGTHGQNAQHFFYQHTEDGNIYGDFYRNAHNIKNLSPKYPQEPIIFQNGPQDSAVYTKASSIDNNQHIFSIANHPESVYIPVQTETGIIYIPVINRDINIRQNSNSPYFHDQPSSGFIMSDRPGQRTFQGDYITPIDVQDTPSLENLAVPKLSPVSGPKKYIFSDKTAAAVSQTGMSSTDGAYKFPPASHDSTLHSIDASNYLQPRHQKTPNQETTFNTQAQITKPSKLDNLILANSNTHPLMSDKQQQGPELRHTVRPDSLPLDQVYLPRKKNAPVIFSQGHTEGQQTGHLPIDNIPPDKIQNRSIINKAQTDDKTIFAKPSENQPRKYRVHHGQHGGPLSLLEEESEEMV